MESDDSDAESVQTLQSQKNQRLDRDESPSQPEEEVDEASSTVALSVRSCTVVLERVPLEEDMERRDPDDGEDMSRRAGRQPLSRIPTLSTLTKKRPTAVHNPESLLSKRDGVSHTPDSGEVPKSMAPSASRETALLLPSVRVPRVSGAEQAASELPSQILPADVAYSLVEESEQQNVVVVTARPALRAEPAYRTSEVKTNVSPEDHTIPHLSSEVSEMQESEVNESVIDGECTTPVDGKGEAGDAGQVTSIADEEPPWESELIKPILDIEEDDDLSSDIQSVDDTAAVESGVLTVSESDEANCYHDKSYSEQENVPTLSSAPAERIPDTDDPTTATVIRTPAKTKAKLSAKRSTCSSFAMFCLLPTTLLLLGGLGLHVWQYGLPRSVEQLLAQLELHWLEGLGVVQEPCSTDCRVRLLESMPIGLYPSSPPPALSSVTSGWLSLLEQANRSVDIAAFYFTLRSSDQGFPEDTDSQGREVFEKLMNLENRGVNLQIAVNSPQTSPQDTQQLAGTGADVREVDLGSLTGGIIHTKLWVVDQKHMYLGSANMDWRSLSQVKEVGISLEDCSCLAQDASRIFGVYWNIDAEKDASLPPYWPARFSALSSALHPLQLKLNGVPARVYLSSAPPQISARGRTDDLASILSVISDAQKSVYISVMDYLPLSQYTQPLRFWPAIDSALRSAACTRGVEVRLMVSCWQHSSESMFIFLQSLLVLHRPPLRCNINIRVFVVPSTAEQSKILFARVNHAKYMVTDRVLYIGTSNWSENYFTHTAGVGLVVNQTGSEVGPGQVTLRSQAEELFLRDWTSDYAIPLPDNEPYVCPHHHH